jgi:hypothetical protein
MYRPFLPPYIRMSLNFMQYLYLHPERTVTSEELIEMTMSERYPSVAVLNMLTESGYIRGKTGSYGGYRLVEDVPTKTLAQAFEELGWSSNSALPTNFASQIAERELDVCLQRLSLEQLFTAHGTLFPTPISGAV